jgi:hypothetical protein
VGRRGNGNRAGSKRDTSLAARDEGRICCEGGSGGSCRDVSSGQLNDSGSRFLLSGRDCGYEGDGAGSDVC